MVHLLAGQGEPASVHVIGGAAVALVNPARTATADIDGFIRPAAARPAIAELQLRWGLEADWFNWHAQGLQPPVAGPEIWQEVLREGEVILYAARTDALLAMKLHAARAKDMADIAFLMDACNVRSLEDAAAVYEHHYPGDVLSPRAQARVEHVLDAHRSSQRLPHAPPASAALRRNAAPRTSARPRATRHARKESGHRCLTIVAQKVPRPEAQAKAEAERHTRRAKLESRRRGRAPAHRFVRRRGPAV